MAGVQACLRLQALVRCQRGLTVTRQVAPHDDAAQQAQQARVHHQLVAPADVLGWLPLAQHLQQGRGMRCLKASGATSRMKPQMLSMYIWHDSSMGPGMMMTAAEGAQAGVGVRKHKLDCWSLAHQQRQLRGQQVEEVELREPARVGKASGEDADEYEVGC